MAQIALVDVGELGWSLELAAHGRWLAERGNELEVLVYEDRRALHPYAKYLRLLPNLNAIKDGLGIQGITNLREVMQKHAKFKIYKDLEFRCKKFNKTSFKPYRAMSYKPSSILVFPRKRLGPHGARNLPESFYTKIAKRFPVVTLGRLPEAYKIAGADCRVSSDSTVQDVIDWCSTAICAVGSQSSLPKLSLLQGVPTFMIGHQKERHTVTDNWMNTECAFHETNYTDFDEDKCLEEVCGWIERKKHSAG